MKYALLQLQLFHQPEETPNQLFFEISMLTHACLATDFTVEGTTQFTAAAPSSPYAPHRYLWADRHPPCRVVFPS